MTDQSKRTSRRKQARSSARPRMMAVNRLAQGVPELVSVVYHQAPMRLRAKLLEILLRPVGPLALVTIAAGAFGRFLYRLQRRAMPISIEDAGRITSDHVLELARYVEQCSPDALLKFGALIAGHPLGLATISSSALLMALGH